MGRVDSSKMLTVEKQVAFLASEAEMQDVIGQIADLFAKEGNPPVVGARKLEPWSDYIPRLIDEGVLLEHRIGERVEYELAGEHRRWLAPEYLVEHFKVAMRGQSIQKIQQELVRYGRKYGYNPGVVEALKKAYIELLRETSLSEYKKAMSSVRSRRHLRAALGEGWDALVDRIRAVTDDGEVAAILEEIGIFRYENREWQLKPRITDLIALAKAQSISDIEFILERLEVEPVER